MLSGNMQAQGKLGLGKKELCNIGGVRGRLKDLPVLRLIPLDFFFTSVTFY